MFRFRTRRPTRVADGSALTALLKVSQPTRIARSRWLVLLACVGLALLSAFLFSPGSIAAKSHLALHGICAQRPSHSLRLGGETLPMDARMTGIYIGAVVIAM